MIKEEELEKAKLKIIVLASSLNNELEEITIGMTRELKKLKDTYTKSNGGK